MKNDYQKKAKAVMFAREARRAKKIIGTYGWINQRGTSPIRGDQTDEFEICVYLPQVEQALLKKFPDLVFQ